LRQLGVALLQGVIILAVMSAIYVVAHLAFYQRLPRWK
jgi:hypothetical protein